jgi:hypothetical protein
MKSKITIIMLLILIASSFELNLTQAQEANDLTVQNQLSQPTPTPKTTSTSRFCTKVGNATGPSPCEQQPPQPQPNSDQPGTPQQPGTQSDQTPSIDAGNLKQAILDQFGVTMQGAWGEQALRWVYEKFYQLKQTNPKFIDLIRGQSVVLIADAGGANAFGNVAKVGQGYAEGAKFLGTFIHEMSHVIYWTKPLDANLRVSADGLYGSVGGVTSYGAGDITENYPELISYCLTKRPVGSLTSQERWDKYYRPLAEQITGGACL